MKPSELDAIFQAAYAQSQAEIASGEVRLPDFANEDFVRLYRTLHPPQGVTDAPARDRDRLGLNPPTTAA